MKKLIIIMILFTGLSSHAVELDKKSLKKALQSAHSAGKVKKVMNDMIAYTGSDKNRFLADRIGKDNFTYFLLTLKEHSFKGLDLSVKGKPEESGMVVFKKLFKDGFFISTEDVKNLKIQGNKCSFSVDNECLKGAFLFEMDDKGQIIKMVIPQKGSKSMKDRKIVFTK